MAKSEMAETCSRYIMYNYKYSCVMTAVSMHVFLRVLRNRTGMTLLKIKIEAEVFSKYYVSARYDILTVELPKIQVFRVVTPYRFVK